MYIHTYTHIYICVHKYTHTYMYVYNIYIYIFIYTWKLTKFSSTEINISKMNAYYNVQPVPEKMGLKMFIWMNLIIVNTEIQCLFRMKCAEKDLDLLKKKWLNLQDFDFNLQDFDGTTIAVWSCQERAICPRVKDMYVWSSHTAIHIDAVQLIQHKSHLRSVVSHFWYIYT